MAVSAADSPFDRTLFADAQSRKRLLRAISAATASRGHWYGGHRSSFFEASAMKAAAMDDADRGLFNAARLAVIQERQACADVARLFDPKAAEAILARPLPDAWRSE